MTDTTIEWTDKVWNPVTGCTKVSPGCDHCYAERIFERFHGEGSFQSVSLHPKRLEQPLHWRKPSRVFVNSMSDLFHATVPHDYIGKVWRVMEAAPQHRFQILTKRAERMERVVNTLYASKVIYPTPNVWLGVSVESPQYYSRIRHLQRSHAIIRFLSCEPLLEPLPNLPLDGIDWVIVGGESGHGARPMHPDWVRDIHIQCLRAGVPFFFKQWGAWYPIGPVYEDPDDPLTEQVKFEVMDWELSGREVHWLAQSGESYLTTFPLQPPPDGAWYMVRRSKKHSGRILDGRTWDEMPVPVVVA